jgi:hypothetical protein
MRFKIYEDKAGKFRWRVTSTNGEIVGASSQGFTSRWFARQNAALLRRAL